MRRRAYGWRCLSVAALLLAAPALRAGDDEKSLIMCGDRVGQIHLNRDDEPIEKWLGKPSDSSAGAGGTGVDTWYSKSSDGQTQELSVSMRYVDPNRKNPPRPRVETITVTSPFFHTLEGNSTRSDPAAFWKEFPDLRFMDTQEGMDGSHLQLYDSTGFGLALLIEPLLNTGLGKPWGKCRAIVVHRAGVKPAFVNIGGSSKPKTGG